LVKVSSCSWILLMAGWPSMVVIMSRARSPAAAAEPPGVTAWTYSPSDSRPGRRRAESDRRQAEEGVGHPAGRDDLIGNGLGQVDRNGKA
jgi:hypothetical protein